MDAQGVGSAITYGRRYSLAAVVGVAPDDDDGEAAVGRGAHVKSHQEKPAAEPESRTATVSHLTVVDTKHEENVERVRGALRRLYDNDKAAALAKVEELTAFPGRDGKAVPGVRDYRTLTGKRLARLADKLEELKEAA